MKVSSADTTSASMTATEATRSAKRRVSWRCTEAGSPSRTSGRHNGIGLGSNSTSIGRWLPLPGTSTVPIPDRNRESSVRASCNTPQRSRAPWRIFTSPRNTFITTTACGAPDQPPAGGDSSTR